MTSKVIAEHCRKILDLKNAKLGDEYYYRSLPLCVIDAVFSIGIRYAIVRNVVRKFCDKLEIERLRTSEIDYPEIDQQFSIDELLSVFDKFDLGEIIEHYFGSKNRTSPNNGILKSEAVFRFCNVLRKFEVNYFQDLSSVIGNEKFESAIKEIPGQGSGLSTTYFYMLAGEDGKIKADRMIKRFIKSCIHREVTASEASTLIVEAYEILAQEYPALTPRNLDHEIWKYQRSQD